MPPPCNQEAWWPVGRALLNELLSFGWGTSASYNPSSYHWLLLYLFSNSSPLTRTFIYDVVVPRFSRRQRFCFWSYFATRAIFLWPWKPVSVSVLYLFYQPMDEKIKTWTLRFPAKENPNMEKALFDRPIVLQYDFKAKYRLISRKFSGMKFFQPSVRFKTNQKLRTFVSVR